MSSRIYHLGGPIGIVSEMLRTAAAVGEALDIASSDSWGEELRNRWFFADAAGDAVANSAGAIPRVSRKKPDPPGTYELFASGDASIRHRAEPS